MKKIACMAVVLFLSFLLPLDAFAFMPGVDGANVGTLAGTGSHGAWDGGLAQFNMPFGIAGQPGGSVVVADTFNNVIRSISAHGDVSTFAGLILETGDDNFPLGFYLDASLSEAGFNRPAGVAVDADGRIFIADSENHAIRIISEGMVFTFAGGNGRGFADGNPNVSMFNLPGAIAVCPEGNLLVADTGNHVIRKITPDGISSTVAGQAGQFGYAGGYSSLFDSPQGIAVDAEGSIFVADTGNNLIRVIEGGQTRTLAGSRIVGTEGGHGDVWDLAPIGGFRDGFGDYALFNQPIGLAIWNGYLLVADSANHVIRIVSPDGEARTLLGSGAPGYVDGAARQAAFHFPMGIYAQAGRLLITDTGNNMIRFVELR